MLIPNNSKDRHQSIDPSIRTYGTRLLAGVTLQQFNNLSFLCRGTAADDHCGTLTGQLHELVLIELQTYLQCIKY